MKHATADVSKNRLYITLKGSVGQGEYQQIASQAIDMIKKLKPGFDVVTDISEFEPATQKAAESLLLVHKALMDHGVNRIVRVVGKELKATVGKIQFERASRDAGIVADSVDSLEDAECLLDR
jgi:hypothetical protein